jgi:hypothetical protein
MHNTPALSLFPPLSPPVNLKVLLLPFIPLFSKNVAYGHSFEAICDVTNSKFLSLLMENQPENEQLTELFIFSHCLEKVLLVNVFLRHSVIIIFLLEPALSFSKYI